MKKIIFALFLSIFLMTACAPDGSYNRTPSYEEVEQEIMKNGRWLKDPYNNVLLYYKIYFSGDESYYRWGLNSEGGTFLQSGGPLKGSQMYKVLVDFQNKGFRYVDVSQIDSKQITYFGIQVLMRVPLFPFVYFSPGTFKQFETIPDLAGYPSP